MEDELRTCGDCEYWLEDKDTPLPFARCRQGPPQAVRLEERTLWKYPKIHKNQICCGQFVQRIVGKINMEVEGDAGMGGTQQQRRDDQSIEA